LALFAAIAHARIKGHVVAQAADPLQGRRAVADQGGALDRSANLAVLHAVAHGPGKTNVTVREVDLSQKCVYTYLSAEPRPPPHGGFFLLPINNF